MQQAFADAADAVVMMMNDSADAAMNHLTVKSRDNLHLRVIK